MRTRIITATTCLVVAAAALAPAAANATPITAIDTAREAGAEIPDSPFAPQYSVTPEGGGSWTYGTNGPNNTAYSNFYHPTRKHGSSVQNGRGNLNQSGTVLGGATAKSSISKTTAGNLAFYRFVG